MPNLGVKFRGKGSSLAFEHLVQKQVGIQLLQLRKDGSHRANVLGIKGLEILKERVSPYQQLKRQVYLEAGEKSCDKNLLISKTHIPNKSVLFDLSFEI